MYVTHPLQPIYNQESKVLILGSIPSLKSREELFYYAHPKNRFWSTLEKVYEEKIGNTTEDKIQFLLKHHIALFDVVKSCDIESSKDQSIKNVVPNDFSEIFACTDIKMIFCTGKKAYQLYQKYSYPITKREAILLPSTSPANCPKNIEQILYQEYKKIKMYTDK